MLFPSRSCVSSAGFVGIIMFGSVELMMGAGVVCLKNSLVGKYITSVLDFVSPFPTCISKPIDSKILLIISSPLMRSSRLWNMNDPSSRYSMWYVLKVELVRHSRLMVCPVSFAPVWMFVMSPRWNCGLGMFALVHVASSTSEKAVMIMRKMTGDKLSPCCSLCWFVCGRVGENSDFWGAGIMVTGALQKLGGEISRQKC